jgi:hypothetical protein
MLPMETLVERIQNQRPFFAFLRCWRLQILKLSLVSFFFLIPQISFAQIDNNFFNGGGIRVGDSTTTCPGNGGGIRFDADSSDGGGLQYCDGTSWLDILTGTITGDVSQGGNSFAAPMIIGTNDNNTLAFETNGSTRMTIDTSGNVGISTISPSDRLHVVGDIRVGTSGSNGCLKDFGGGTITGTCSSDERFKKEIKPLESVVDRFAKLSPSTYYWRAEEFPEKDFSDAQQLGLIAQELQEVFPDLVVEDQDGFLRVKYTDLNMYFMKSFVEHYNQWVTFKIAQQDRDQKQDRAISSIREQLDEKDQCPVF